MFKVFNNKNILNIILLLSYKLILKLGKKGKKKGRRGKGCNDERLKKIFIVVQDIKKN